MSADPADRQQSFIDAFSLTFPMVPDTAKKVIDDYGARAVLGIVAKRSTFLSTLTGRSRLCGQRSRSKDTWTT